MPPICHRMILHKIFTSITLLIFFTSTILPPGVAYGQTAISTPSTVLNLPQPGTMVELSPFYVPLMLKGVTINPDNPFKLNFLVDSGHEQITQDALKTRTQELVKYFLAALTLPEDDIWVNLSPYEQNRIAPEMLGRTDMGRDLLSQDYILKQLMASLTYPDQGLGQTFWNQVYQKAYELYGTTQIPLNTFNKVWIIPDEAEVYVHENTAYVVKSHLKVMLEEDYLARKNNLNKEKNVTKQLSDGDAQDLSRLSSSVARQVLLPAIEREVNEGKNFATLRQIYQALILASWYKKTLTSSLLNQVYSDHKKIVGVDVDDKAVKQKIYDQYLQAFQKGVYNFIREDYDEHLQTTIPRKYFSGGFSMGEFTQKILKVMENRQTIPSEAFDPVGTLQDLEVLLAQQQRDGIVGQKTGANSDLYEEIKGRIKRIALRETKTGWNRIFVGLGNSQTPADRRAVRAALQALEGVGFDQAWLDTISQRIFLVNVKEERLTRTGEELGGLIIRHHNTYKILLSRQQMQNLSPKALEHLLHELVEVEFVEAGMTNEHAHILAQTVSDAYQEQKTPENALRAGQIVLANLRKRFGQQEISKLPAPSSEDGVVGASHNEKPEKLIYLNKDVAVDYTSILKEAVIKRSDFMGGLTVRIILEWFEKNQLYSAEDIEKAVEDIQKLGEAAIPDLIKEIKGYGIETNMINRWEKNNRRESMIGEQALNMVIALALYRFGPNALPYFAEVIGKRDLLGKIADKKLALINIMLAMNDPQVDTVLLNLMDKEPEVLVALGKRGVKAAIPRMRKHLKARQVENIFFFHDGIRYWNFHWILCAVRGLSLLKDEASIDDVLRIYNNIKKPTNKIPLLEATRGFVHPKYANILNTIDLYDPSMGRYDWQTYFSIMIYHKPEKACRLLAERLKKEKLYLLFNAIKELQESKRVDLLIRMQQMIDHKDTQVQIISALGELAQESKEARDHLRSIIAAKDAGSMEQGQYSEFAFWALLPIAEEEDLPMIRMVIAEAEDLSAVLEMPESSIIKVACQALINMGAEGQQQLVNLYFTVQENELLLPHVLKIEGLPNENIDSYVNMRKGKRARDFRDIIALINEAREEYVPRLLRLLIKEQDGQEKYPMDPKELPLPIRIADNRYPLVLQAFRDLLRENNFNISGRTWDFIRTNISYYDQSDLCILILSESKEYEQKWGVLEVISDLLKSSFIFFDQDKQRQLLEQIRIILAESKVDASDREFVNEDRVNMRVQAVKVLGVLSGTYQDSVQILQDETEHPLVRQEARNNLWGYEVAFAKKAKDFVVNSEEEKTATMMKRFISRLKRIRDKQRQANLELYQQYQNLPELETVAGSLSQFINEEQAAVVAENDREETTPSRTMQLGKTGHDFSDKNAPTPRVEDKEGQENNFVAFLAEHTDKSKEQIEQEADYDIYKQHYQIMRMYGFVDREDSREAEIIHRIFAKVTDAYNEHAASLHLPAFRGKLFIVDSPDVNAFASSGHDDVYVCLGLVREIAHYAKMLNIPSRYDVGSKTKKAENDKTVYIEDIFFAILAHEMTHVMQGTAYVGLTIQALQANKALMNEILDLKRQAEFNADQGALILTGLAGYNTDAVKAYLEFFRRQTKNVTVEYAFEEHPHPKQRINHIEKFLEKESNVLITRPYQADDQDQALQSSPDEKMVDRYAQWHHRHLGAKAQDIRSEQDLIRQFGEAQSIDEVLELIKITRYRQTRVAAKVLAQEVEANKKFAKHLYLNNVLDLMSEVVTDWEQKPEQKLPGHLSMANNEGLLTQFLTQNDEGPPKAEPFLLNKLQSEFNENAADKKFLKNFNKQVIAIRERIQAADLDIERRLQLLDLIARTYDQAIAQFKNRFSDEKVFEAYIKSEPVQKKDYQAVVASVGRGDMSAMEELLNRPFSFYRIYGRKDLNEAMDAKDYAKTYQGASVSRVVSRLGIDLKNIDPGKIFLERADSDFYEKDIRLLPVSTQAERKRLFEAVMISFILVKGGITDLFNQNYFFYLDIDDWKSLIQSDQYPMEFKQAIFQAVLRVAPDDADHSGENDEAYYLSSNKIKQWLALYLSGTAIKENGYEGTDKLRTEDIYFETDFNFSQRWLPESYGDRRMERQRAVQRQFLNYLRFMIPEEADEIFSSTFEQELSANSLIAGEKIIQIVLNKNKETDALPYEYIERQDMDDFAKERLFKGLKDIVAQQSAGRGDSGDRPLGDDNAWPVKLEYLRRELSHYSVFFRNRILLQLMDDMRAVNPWHFHSFHPTLAQMKQLLFDEYTTADSGEKKHLLFPSDAYTLLHLYAKRVEGEKIDRIRYKNKEVLNDDIKTFEWLFDHKPRSLAVIDKEAILGYTLLRLKAVSLDMKTNFLAQGNSEEEFAKLSDKELAELSKQFLTSEEAFAILQRVAKVSELNFEHHQQVTTSESDELMYGRLSAATQEKMRNDCKGDNGRSSIKVSSPEAPLGFTRAPEHPLEQRLFRMLFALDLNQLQQLAKQQKQVRADLTIKKGRLQQELPETNAQKMIDVIILYRLLAKFGLHQEEFNEDNFANFIAVEYYAQASVQYGVKIFGFGTRSKNSDLSDTQVTELAVSALQLQQRSVAISKRCMDFFKELAEGGFVGKYQDADAFFAEIAKHPIGLRAFLHYSELMQDVQLPSAKENALEPSTEERTYIEALMQAVDIIGEKARVFKEYDAQVLKLLRSKLDFQKRLKLLFQFFPKASLFRDGFIDRWERSLVPEVDLNLIEQAYINKQRLKGRLGDEYGAFETMGLLTPLQWDRVKSEDFRMAPERAKNILEFYRLTIKCMADPQRQLRMGETAIKIYRQNYPDTSFQDELRAITDFFPFASELRDEHLHELLNRHVIPNDGKITDTEISQVRKLFSSFQNLQYDEELTNANFAQQVIEAILSLASRESRVEILFWVLDPKSNAKPRFIVQLKDRLNINFDELPQHIEAMPESYRVKILENMFLGENGLFSPQSEQDEKLMDDLVRRLFEKFFSDPREAGTTGRQSQLSPEAYQLVKELFPIIIKGYHPARRTSLVLSLLRRHQELDEMSDGKKMAALLSAMGPVGDKISQVLSEQKNWLPNDSLRRDLGTAKKNAPRINKLAVLQVLLNAGFKMEDIKIGRRLGTASMGQVHEGWIRVNGVWEHVVIKVIKPKINRMIDGDIEVLRKVFQYLKEKKNYDVEYLANDIDEWIAIESNLINEVQNTGEVADGIGKYKSQTTLAFKTPRIIVGDRVTVMIGSMEQGVGADMLFEPVGFHGWIRSKYFLTRESLKGWVTRKDLIKNELVERGNSPEEAESIAEELTTNSSEILRQTRKLLLYLILEDGRFHADLHTENILLGKAAALIDFGLIGRLNQEQRAGAKQILKGILLHDANLIFEGISSVHLNSQQLNDEERQDVRRRLDDHRAEVLIDIEAMFKRGMNIESEMKELLSIVGSRRFAGSKDFSNLIKAVTTAIWLFPTQIHTVKPVLDDLAEELGLTSQEKDQVMRVHGRSIVLNTIALMKENAKSDCLAVWNQVSDPIREKIQYWNNRWRKTKVANEISSNLRKVFGDQPLTADESKESRAAAGKALTALTFSELFGMDQDLLKKTKLDEPNPILVGKDPLKERQDKASPHYVKDYRRSKFSQIEYSILVENLEQIPGYQKISQNEKQEVRESIDLYYRIYAKMGFHPYLKNKNVVLAKRENNLFQALIKQEFKDLSQQQLIARVLTARVMKERHRSRDEAAGKETPFRSFLNPRSPFLNYIAERMADSYLAYLDDEDMNEPNWKPRGQRLRDYILYDKNDFYSEMDEEINLEFDLKHTGEVFSARQMDLQDSALDREYQQTDIRRKLLEDFNELKPGNFFESAEISEGKVLLKATRTGFTETGRFEIEFINLVKNEYVLLSLTEEEFYDFLKSGRAKPVVYQRWERDDSAEPQTPYPREPFPRFSKEVLESMASQDKADLIDIVLASAPSSAVDAAPIPEPSASSAPGASGEERKTDPFLLSSENEVGGIDLSQKWMNVKFSGDESIRFAPNTQTLAPGFEGFTPIIINAVPIPNLPAYLGVSENREKENKSMSLSRLSRK